MSLALRYAVRSDRGLIRGNNEDSVYAGPRLLALADGMGGHVGGEVASKVAISALAHLDDDAPSPDLIGALRDATDSANQHLRELVEADPGLEGMGTTLTALLFAGNRLGLVHVGDSRCYLLRGSQFAQITHDDTYVQALVDEGQITLAEASNHPQRSLLLRAVNGGDLVPDLSVREVRPGDRYLLCSDGLTDVLSNDTLHEALRTNDPRAAADRLVELALRGGGPDNVTVIVADVIDRAYGDDIPVVAGAAGLHNGRREVRPNSAAGRAAIAAPTSRQRAGSDVEPTATPPPRPRRTGRRLVFGFVALLMLAGAGYGVWQWIQSQYYVGAAGERVGVYRGINASVGPVHLFDLVDTSSLALADLQQLARDKVRDGSLTASSQAEASDIIGRLEQDQMLPECSEPTPSIGVPSTIAPSIGVPSTSAPAAGRTKAPTAAAATTTPRAARSTQPPTTTEPPSTVPQVPGRDCRTVG
ncbi:MAG: serine/threonine-protein phosphatase [Actinobacteria bacterium]|nr:serine/threonine-protein phosphatase [Actinomycetota bacterium]MBI3686254.1 serine/threonine-protein phosphatase [Actinomycetota bacterium]